MTTFEISDLHLFPLADESGRLVVLGDDDHLLRRFGQVELRRLEKGIKTPFTLRAVADEVWAVVLGSVQLVLVDQRKSSPSEAVVVSIKLEAQEPQGLLIPFGVAYAFEAFSAAQLIRLATHADDTHSEDKLMPRETFAQLLAEA